MPGEVELLRLAAAAGVGMTATRRDGRVWNSDQIAQQTSTGRIFDQNPATLRVGQSPLHTRPPPQRTFDLFGLLRIAEQPGNLEP
jgi:hypothetical protein